jgi:hypothetical protein
MKVTIAEKRTGGIVVTTTIEPVLQQSSMGKMHSVTVIRSLLIGPPERSRFFLETEEEVKVFLLYLLIPATNEVLEAQIREHWRTNNLEALYA